MVVEYVEFLAEPGLAIPSEFDPFARWAQLRPKPEIDEDSGELIAAPDLLEWETGGPTPGGPVMQVYARWQRAPDLDDYDLSPLFDCQSATLTMIEPFRLPTERFSSSLVHREWTPTSWPEHFSLQTMAAFVGVQHSLFEDQGRRIAEGERDGVHSVIPAAERLQEIHSQELKAMIQEANRRIESGSVPSES
ncbi:MAG: hypothetical protein KDC39_08580 [Actinobacteria bacterium]|nr:hypothetical protein [Actinomycetota bacterium]